MSEKMSDYTMSEHIYIYVIYIIFRWYARNYVRRTCRGGDHQYHSSSTCHGCLIHSLCHNWFANNYPISYHYSCIYIYIERAISTLISPTQYHPNKSPHIFISSQVPPSQIVFPLCDPIIDPHVWFFTYIEPVFVKDHHPSPCCLNQRGFLNSWWRNPLMLLTVLTVLTLLSLQHNCCPLVI